MTNSFIVRVPFSRKCPITGELVEYKKGDIVAHPERLADIRDSEHAAHGHNMQLPDDHDAVLPHLSDGHPALAALPEGHPVRLARAIAAAPHATPAAPSRRRDSAPEGAAEPA
ncbi:MAG TPA: hypothetical protein VFA12_20205 [Stellaceae bacterium]|nr:hypothetical protein [Stellaceae bacterium]